MPALDKHYFKDFKTELTVTSPGRINLIGEHTDYNNGFVLPTAIDRKIHFYFRKNDTVTTCNIYSKSYDAFLQVDLKNVRKSDKEWENYVLGVIHELLMRNATLSGFDCIIESELPIGAGISSSAALECGMAIGLNEFFNLKQPVEELIRLSRDAEHRFVGTKCGIMDQFAVVMSKENHVLLLDCQSLDYELIPVHIAPYQILLLNTNVSHNLASSEYNKRREECESGVKIMQQKYRAIQSLRDVSLSILKEFESQLDRIVYQRCQYVISENERVLKAVQELKAGNLEAFGNLMYQSHEGLQHLYEVSCPELDFLVDFSRANTHILGSRMMGGGFGGCTINIIHEDDVEAYITEVSEAYKHTFHRELTAIVVNPSQGTFIKN
ncbi:galactokinase [uncultured Kordia sp.]|uniref:galactokinase n=1 Tax=uncultured Kordia sp. TaxID=507699 RepID=UPI00345B8320